MRRALPVLALALQAAFCAAQHSAALHSTTLHSTTLQSATLHSTTLDAVRSRGALLCGVDRSQAEYSSTDEHGSRKAFDQDLCKALAVAVLGAGARVTFTYYADDATSRKALVEGKADVIASLSGEPADGGIGYTAPVLYDDTALMVPKAGGVESAQQLSGRKICFPAETATEDHLRRWFAEHHADLLPFPFQEEGEMEAAFVTGNCAAIAGDLSRLAQTRAETGVHAPEFAVLPQTLGEDTLRMAYRSGDVEWKAVVDGVRDGLVAAEEAGTPQAVGTGGWLEARQFGERHGLAPDWLAAVLQAVGNYGELFERDLGPRSPMGLNRGRSALAGAGGLLRSQPLR